MSGTGPCQYPPPVSATTAPALFLQPSVGAKESLLSIEYICHARTNCFWLLAQAAPVALDFALAKAGKSMPAKIAMMAMTTSNSMRVKPELLNRRPEVRKGHASNFMNGRELQLR